jgi:hypothetical protein
MIHQARTLLCWEAQVELMAVVEDQSGKEYKMDHYQVRFPTNVSDIGRVLYDLARELAG